VPLESLDLCHAPGFDTDFFPAGVNVEFVAQVSERHVRMRVYERGSAETMSCGTGACAVAAVALRDAGLDDGDVTVDVRGGQVTVGFDGGECWLRGPAVLVAEGDVDLEAVGA
jgi:diaminopimelate epimerase